MNKAFRSLLIAVPSLSVVAWTVFTFCVYQRADMMADTSIRSPRFDPGRSPSVVFDEGHGNLHHLATTFAPFALLLKNDGILLRAHEGRFTDPVLHDVELLIIANATPAEDTEGPTSSAFTEGEIDVLRAWVDDGGSLLLIADHEPFGTAAAELASAFGARMSSVWTADPLRFNEAVGKRTWLEFSEDNGGLGRHDILQGDVAESAVRRVMTFTGQSLGFDPPWTSVLTLSSQARDYARRADAEAAVPDPTTYRPAPGHSQLMARPFGKGRIVMAGEAALFTAQEVRVFFRTYRAGFDYGGYDNKRLVLNTVHWLLHEPSRPTTPAGVNLPSPPA